MILVDEKTFTGIQIALDDRERLSVEARADLPMPEIAKTGLVPAMVWHLGAMRQDEPMIFWMGLSALAWNGVTFLVWVMRGVL